MWRKKLRRWKEHIFEPETGLRMKSACVTHIGNVRSRNEDNLYFNSAFLPLEHNGVNEVREWCCSTGRLRAVAVFDGMGGECAGDLASFISASRFHEEYSKFEGKGQMPTGDQVTSLLLRVSDAVCSAAKENHYKLIGATATILFVKDDRGMVANLGDSPMYRFRDGELEVLSHPHTDAELLRQQGVKRKPALTQFLGIDRREFIIEPYIKEIMVKEGDQYLLCSDGLTDLLSDGEIMKILGGAQNVRDKVNILLEQTLERGAGDNTTIILCEMS